MKRIMIATTLLMALISISAEARMAWMKQYKAAYPKAKIVDCIVCHISEDPGEDASLNSYGTDSETALSNKVVNFKSFEGKDSDGDGKTNFDEIHAGTNPGDMSN